MNRTDQNLKFSHLGAPRKIWAISAIHADINKLYDIHDNLYPLFKAGDRIVYTGNYLGDGAHPIETINEILTFRRHIMAVPGVKNDDLVYLRGRHEDMWSNLQQLHFCNNPRDSLRQILSAGLSPTLQAYGIDPFEALKASSEGTLSLIRWTNALKQAIRKHPGHEIFSSQWRRAAFTKENTSSPLLFVHAGIDPHRSLIQQDQEFCWSRYDFKSIERPYNPFSKVFRGYDPAHQGLHINCVTATLDGGCGYGGNLVCAGVADQGDVVELIEA